MFMVHLSESLANGSLAGGRDAGAGEADGGAVMSSEISIIAEATLASTPESSPPAPIVCTARDCVMMGAAEHARGCRAGMAQAHAIARSPWPQGAGPWR